jgi:ribokinase
MKEDTMAKLQIKRIYDDPSEEDGYRVLVDRLWPRGVSKADAAIDEWAKEVAPSTELRKWFGHKEERFEEFAAKYEAELRPNPAAEDFADRCRSILEEEHRPVTLLYAAKSPTINHALVLRRWLERH